MNADEIVKALRKRADAANKRGYSGEASDWLELAELIEQLQAQLEQKTNEAEGMRSNWYKCVENLKESQRRADAAVEFIKYLDRNYSGYMAEDERFAEWRGPQEAGEERKNENLYF